MPYAASPKIFSSIAGALLLVAVFSSSFAAIPAPLPEQEIDYLLSFVGTSGCVFYRNGGAYDSIKAEAHLRAKYEYAEAHQQIHTAEDFIERIASSSSFSGRAYSVKCGGEEEKPTRGWLIDALAQFRAR